MGNWEFVVIFLLVLIGAGVTNILHGFGTMIRERQRVRSYWVHYVWLVVLLFTYLSIWFSFFNGQDTILGFWEFVGSVLSFSILYLLTVLSFPDFKSSEPLDMMDHFLRTHRPYFSLWALVWLTPTVTVLLQVGNEPWGALDLMPLFYFALSTFGVLVGSARNHAALAVAIIAGIMSQLLF